MREGREVKKKKYKPTFVNAIQSKGERRRKYKFVRDNGYSSCIATVLKDWTWYHINLYIKTGKEREE